MVEAIKDKCAFCGKEILIEDKNIIANLKTCKGKDSCTKVYCDDECRKKDNPSIEGSLDVNDIFS